MSPGPPDSKARRPRGPVADDEVEERAERIAAEERGFFPDLLRRGLTLGFTGIFMTEEAVRRALGDAVPRDVLEFVLSQSERTRTEFLDRLSREFGRALAALDPAEVARRLLEGRTVEVTARVRLLPREGEEAAAEPPGPAPADPAGAEREGSRRPPARGRRGESPRRERE